MTTSPVPGLTPFRIAVPDEVLSDLQQRLARTRWPIDAPGAPPWAFGASLPYMREVAHHWQTGHDWRHWEARLNALPNYQAEVDGQRLHVIVEPGSGPAPRPLLLTHGWPGSVMEFLDVIEPLAHPERFGGDVAEAFTIIVPSLPGYAFSAAPSRPMSHRDIAQLWHGLMHDVLGYERYWAQGGDVGAGVTSWLAFDHPEAVEAIHLNFVSLQKPLEADSPLTPEEIDWQRRNEARRVGEVAYQQIQATKSQTLAYGLTDSPIGLAAWILEKFHGWTVPGSDGPPPFDMDHLLANVMMHWLAGPHAAMWTYRFALAAQGSSRMLPAGQRIEVPTGVLLFPSDISLPPPDHWVQRSYNLVHRVDAPRGGHFAALETGLYFVEEVRRYFRRFR